MRPPPTSKPGLPVAVVTYNCGRVPIQPDVFSRHLSRALAADDTSPSPLPPPAILAFALQEIAPVAHSFLGGSFLAPYLEAVHQSVRLTSRRWGRKDSGGGGGGDGGEYRYGALLSRHVGMTALAVFVRDDYAGRVDVLDVGGVGVGWYEMGNKGAVAVGVRVRGEDGDGDDEGRDGREDDLEITFVAAHLAPMEGEVERRNDDWKAIARGLVLTPVHDHHASPSSTRDASGSDEQQQQPLLPSHDANDDDTDSNERSTAPAATAKSHDIYAPGRHVFVAGDLNYRTSDTAPRPSSRAMWPRLSADADSPHHYRHLLAGDQLAREMAAGRVLQGFVEAPLTFAPTYKYAGGARKAVAALEEQGEGDEGANDGEGDDGWDKAWNEACKVSPLDWPWAPHRWPSWCDRVLYLGGEGEEFSPARYTSLPLMSTSDHRPVLLLHEIPWSLPRDKLERKRPFAIDPEWQARRTMARRLEVLTGLGAYLSTTWEGGSIFAALLVGSIGGWFAIHNFL